MQKLALGTIQFGKAYGINNPRGQIPQVEVFEILQTAYDHGVNLLQTAYDYGDSEAVIGELIAQTKLPLKVVTKVPPVSSRQISSAIDEILARLQSSHLYGLMVWEMDHFKNHPEIWHQLQLLKKNKQVQKLGFTLYYLNQLEWLWEQKISFDLIQIPYSVFDQRFEPYFEKLKKQGVEIHTRSAFVQGLVFKNLEDLAPHFEPLKSKLVKLKALAESKKIPLWALYLDFCCLNSKIDQVVVGVDSLDQLHQLLKYPDYFSAIEELYTTLASFKENNEELILPVHWKRKV